MEDHNIVKKTKFALLSHSILSEPFIVLYALLPFILHKNLGATPFQIAFLIMLKPSVSVFSFYWSSRVVQKRNRLKTNLIAAEILARLPFIGLIFFSNIWYIIFAAGAYMFFYRGGIPAWMEILKLNLPRKKRDKLFSFGMALGYLEGAFIGLGIGFLLDQYASSWRWLLISTSAFAFIGIFIKCFLPVKFQEEKLESHETPTETKKEKFSFLTPWKDSFKLIRERKDFARFQWGFMACGFGIMFCLPAIPQFFNEVLHLSYKQLASAKTIFYALGFVISAPFWARLLNKIPLNFFASLIFAGFAGFHMLLLFSPISLHFVYLAFVFYGLSQAGSRLLWHMSGPIFSNKENSSKFSGVNICLVGIRGLIAPPLGGLFCSGLGPLATISIGISLCLLGGIFMLVNVPERLKTAAS